jgi:hypothetical protein
MCSLSHCVFRCLLMYTIVIFFLFPSTFLFVCVYVCVLCVFVQLEDQSASHSSTSANITNTNNNTNNISKAIPSALLDTQQPPTFIRSPVISSKPSSSAKGTTMMMVPSLVSDELFGGEVSVSPSKPGSGSHKRGGGANTQTLTGSASASANGSGNRHTFSDKDNNNAGIVGIAGIAAGAGAGVSNRQSSAMSSPSSKSNISFAFPSRPNTTTNNNNNNNSVMYNNTNNSSGHNNSMMHNSTHNSNHVNNSNCDVSAHTPNSANNAGGVGPSSLLRGLSQLMKSLSFRGNNSNIPDANKQTTDLEDSHLHLQHMDNINNNGINAVGIMTQNQHGLMNNPRQASNTSMESTSIQSLQGQQSPYQQKLGLIHSDISLV